MAGPRITTSTAGKMKTTSGNRIFTGSLAAFSRARARRLLRISPACVCRILAALDAARDLPNAQAAAEASAVRNGFDPSAPGRSVLAEGRLGGRQPGVQRRPGGDAVRVTVSSRIDYIFRAGSRTLTATAVAQLPGSAPTTTTSSTTTTTTTCPPPCTAPSAGFTLGSTLASIDTTKAPLLDAVLGAMLQGTAAGGGNADVVGWQGLLSSYVTMSVLQDHLELLHSGVQFGTVDQMLAADVTLAELAQATANALNASGDANATLYAGPGGIIAQSTSTAILQLGELFRVEAGAGDAFLATRFNAFQLLSGSAMVANGTNTISVPDVGVAIPGLGTTARALKVIEGQKAYVGPANGPSISTGQVELTVTPTLDRPIEVTGLTAARLTGALPFALTAAGATATLTDIACPSPGSIRVRADLKPVAGSTSTTLGVRATVLGASVPVFSVATTGSTSSDAPPEDVDFADPGEFTPTAAGKRVGASPLGLSTTTSFDATATALGPLAVPRRPRRRGGGRPGAGRRRARRRRARAAPLPRRQRGRRRHLGAEGRPRHRLPDARPAPRVDDDQHRRFAEHHVDVVDQRTHPEAGRLIGMGPVAPVDGRRATPALVSGTGP